jgi:hypothetical protein
MLPHGALEQLDTNLFTVKGEIKLKALGRRMVVVRDSEGGLFIHNAIMLEDFAPLDALGEVRAIFVPNRFHDIDAGRMHERYPRARLAALPAARKKLEKKFPALETLDRSPSCAKITPLPGLKGDESVMEVEGAGGVTLVYTDALFNLPHGSGLSGALLKMIGTSGGFKMSVIGRLAFLADRRAFRAHLEAQAARTDVERVIVSHGDAVTGNDAVRAAFARAAEALA